MSALYPVVPNAPGVPQVLRQAGQVYGTVSLLTSDAEELFGQLNFQWGIYNANGNAVITADSVAAHEIRKDYQISNYPIEQGQFSSYNKVEMPFEGVVTFYMGGTLAAMTVFKQACLLAAKSLALVSIYTPELQYPYANVTGYRERRSQDQNTSMVTIEVPFKEVRIAASTSAYSTSSTASPMAGGNPVSTAPAQQTLTNTQNSASQDAVSAGTVQGDNSVQVTPLDPLTGPNINPVRVVRPGGA